MSVEAPHGFALLDSNTLMAVSASAVWITVIFDASNNVFYFAVWSSMYSCLTAVYTIILRVVCFAVFRDRLKMLYPTRLYVSLFLCYLSVK